MFPVIQKSLSVLRGMLHICTKHSGQLLCVCLCVREWISTLQKPRQVRSKRCTDQQEWDSVKHLTWRLESQVWTEILCPWLALNLSQGRFSELHQGYRVCTSPGMLCHGNSASLLGWWNCTFCASVLDCAMRGLGEVISKIVCTLRTVEASAQQSESALRLRMSPLFWISFPFRSLQSTEQSSLCLTVGSH